VSLLYIDGFEWIVDQILGFDGAGRWTGTGIATNFRKITDTASGTGAAARQAGSVSIAHTFPATATLVFGVRFRLGGHPSVTKTLIEFAQGGTRQYYVRLLANGAFDFVADGVVLGTSTFVMPVNTWTYMELKVLVHDSAGTVELRFNGNTTPDINLTSQDTQTTATAEVDQVELHSDALLYDWDDLYLDDTTFHGDVFVETIVADGVGTDADFTPSAGSNFENVEELPTDNDTTYNESLTVDDRDRFTHGNIPADTETVLGVQVGIWCKKTVAGDREVRTLAHDGVTEGEGAAQTPGVDYTWLYDMFEDHPTGAAAWTESEVNAGQFGYTVES
jgi:hypothetical protein